MKASPPSRASLLKLLDRAGWRVLRQGILRRVCHDLSGRVSTLGGLAYLGESWEPAMAWEVLREETGRLERTAELLGLLVDRMEAPQLLTPLDLLGPAARVVESLPGMEGLRIEVEAKGGAPPIRGDRTLLFRAVAILMAGLARSCSRRAVLRVEARGKGGALLVTLQGGDPDPQATGEAVPGSTAFFRPLGGEILPARARRVLGCYGVSVGRGTGDQGSFRLYLRFPPASGSAFPPEGSGGGAEGDGSPSV